MKLFDCDFRELDRKWIAVSKWKDIKRIGKKYKLELVDILSKIKFQMIDNSLLNHLKEKEMIEQKINVAYYQDENILNARNVDIIDEWRHETNPDDIELILITDKKEEFIWGKLELFSKDRLICRLLDDSKYNNHYKKGETVLASIVKNKKDADIIIQYLVEKKNSD